MPQAANITVKKADETTNITYDLLAPAGGDGSKATWRQDTGAIAGQPVGHRAILEVRTMWNGPRTARKAEITFKRPYSTQNAQTTKYESSDSVVLSAVGTLPQAIPAAELNEAVAQFCNLLASALVKDMLKSGYAAS